MSCAMSSLIYRYRRFLAGRTFGIDREHFIREWKREQERAARICALR
jgi:hypothetical protein